MTAEQFCYWLHGFFELNSQENDDCSLTQAQAQMVREHLDSVFTNVIGTLPKSVATQRDKFQKLLNEAQDRRGGGSGTGRIC